MKERSQGLLESKEQTCFSHESCFATKCRIDFAVALAPGAKEHRCRFEPANWNYARSAVKHPVTESQFLVAHPNLISQTPTSVNRESKTEREISKINPQSDSASQVSLQMLFWVCIQP